MSGNYRKLDDAELIKKIQQGCSEVFGELSIRYLWLIRAKAAPFVGSAVPDSEDLIQEGFLGLYQAACTYEEEKSASFRSYAGVCVENRMISAVRTHSSKKNQMLNESISLDDAELSAVSAEDSPERQLEGKEELRRVLSFAKFSLTPLELKALSLYLKGCPRREVTRRSGLSLKAFDNAMHRVRTKLKER